ncbi:uncharacterized protein LOC132729345 [Ruditapes philippinarum]|uniref:uncharacterized protein LOC132729345 n=1 Tax=Ruditapes philippinarum TaxID=129788 RepID=UPI00295A7170|nr:uncharacterized protein LOC132729345 [Ruditapes philippinarum]XP_060571092.1 uncharacterized protein LOC132729345 [Ruditapes philippinarum]XP_060571093.1 uncharacterized protein LOC132729345 [Ruditapes philippinarum]
MAGEYRGHVLAQQADLPAVSVRDQPSPPVHRAQDISPKNVSTSSSVHWFSASLPDEHPCLLTGITFVSGDIVACDNENKTLKRFDINGKFLEELFLHDPCGICTLPNSSEVAVTEPDIKQITVCSLDASLEISFELKTKKKYECVSSYQDKYVAGCCELGSASVDFIDGNGTVLRSILGNVDGKLIFRNPSAIACLPSGDLLISDPGSCALVCVSQNNNTKFKIEPGGRPSGVCSDLNGGIYMAQYDSNLVLRLSSGGNIEGVVVDEKFKLTSPLAMTYDLNQLAITEETPSDRILILKLPSKPTKDADQGMSLTNLRVSTL